ncbi:protein FAM166B-like [Argonauta hians]
MVNQSNINLYKTATKSHIPGYTGFCPQLKFTIGKTFGHATERNLIGDEISPYLSNTEKCLLKRKYPTFEERLRGNKDQILERRRKSPGSIFQENMISGYTGCIPCLQNYHGEAFRNIWRDSLTEFEYNQLKNDIKRQQLGFQPSLNVCDLKCHSGFVKLPEVPTLSMTQTAKDFLPFYSTTQTKPHISILERDNIDPLKYHIPGYAGFVPRYRPLIGRVYPELTRQALCQFTNDLDKTESPICDNKLTNVPYIYPVKGSIIPTYTGHIPGLRDSFGKTLGNNTYDIRKQLIEDGIIKY